MNYWSGLQRILMNALDSPDFPIAPLGKEPARAPRWPAGIGGIDDNILSGGFYGLSAICAPSKLGKSIAAYQSALTAAQNGWSVVYVDAELDDWQGAQRLRNVTQQDPIEWIARTPNFAWRRLWKDVELEVIVQDVVAHVPDGAERILVVIDSLNRVAQRLVRMDGKRKYRIEYFEAMRAIVDWALIARRLSNGQIGFLLTSEPNKRGGTKGEQIEFACDLLLKIKGKAWDRQAELIVDLSREGGAGPLGSYYRNWDKCKFERVPDREEEEEKVAGKQSAMDVLFGDQYERKLI